jgi:hypothetical protein
MEAAVLADAEFGFACANRLAERNTTATALDAAAILRISMPLHPNHMARSDPSARPAAHLNYPRSCSRSRNMISSMRDGSAAWTV